MATNPLKVMYENGKAHMTIEILLRLFSEQKYNIMTSDFSIDYQSYLQ